MTEIKEVKSVIAEKSGKKRKLSDNGIPKSKLSDKAILKPLWTSVSKQEEANEKEGEENNLNTILESFSSWHHSTTESANGAPIKRHAKKGKKSSKRPKSTHNVGTANGNTNNISFI